MGDQPAIMFRALIIDDQPAAREDLRDLLEAHDDVAVVGEAGTSGRARTLLALDNYDLVFLDIDLGHGDSGFDLLAGVRPGARVIFVTGFDDHALRAFEAEALDYLLKPVEPARLAKSLRRLRTPAAGDSTTAFAATSGLVPVKIGPVTRLLRIDDIRSVSSCENYTDVMLAGGERILVRRTMQQWGELLRGAQFARVHRGLIVNVAHLRRVERGASATTNVHFTGGSAPLAVSRRYAPELRAKQAVWQTELSERASSVAADRSDPARPEQHSA